MNSRKEQLQFAFINIVNARLKLEALEKNREGCSLIGGSCSRGRGIFFTSCEFCDIFFKKPSGNDRIHGEYRLAPWALSKAPLLNQSGGKLLSRQHKCVILCLE